MRSAAAHELSHPRSSIHAYFGAERLAALETQKRLALSTGYDLKLAHYAAETMTAAQDVSELAVFRG